MNQYTTKILIGDFNANQLARSTDSEFIHRLMEEHSVQSISYGTTFNTKTGDSTLGLCLVDEFVTSSPFVGGHDLIAATISITIASKPPPEFTYHVRGHRITFQIPSFRSEFLDNSFCIKTSYLWNLLPPSTRDCYVMTAHAQLEFIEYLSRFHLFKGNSCTTLFASSLHIYVICCHLLQGTVLQ